MWESCSDLGLGASFCEVYGFHDHVHLARHGLIMVTEKKTILKILHGEVSGSGCSYRKHIKIPTYTICLKCMNHLNITFVSITSCTTVISYGIMIRFLPLIFSRLFLPWPVVLGRSWRRMAMVTRSGSSTSDPLRSQLDQVNKKYGNE